MHYRFLLMTDEQFYFVRNIVGLSARLDLYAQMNANLEKLGANVRYGPPLDKEGNVKTIDLDGGSAGLYMKLQDVTEGLKPEKMISLEEAIDIVYTERGLKEKVLDGGKRIKTSAERTCG